MQADRERLALAVDALLENAVQHTVAGNLIRLSLECDASVPSAAIVIADGGAGIEQAGLADIFGRLRTWPAADADGAPEDGGTGLGLALVESVARGHRGEVRVQSENGVGSRFELVPQPHPAPMRASTAHRGPGPGHPGGATIRRGKAVTARSRPRLRRARRRPGRPLVRPRARWCWPGFWRCWRRRCC